MSEITPTVKQFECFLLDGDNEPYAQKRIIAKSAGLAKSRFLREAVDWFQDLVYTSICARVIGRVRDMETSEAFIRNAKYRGIDFAKVGMRVKVGDDMGTITGHNSSANLNVLFDDDSRYPGEEHNCHPHWDIIYFDVSGTEIASYNRQRKP